MPYIHINLQLETPIARRYTPLLERRHYTIQTLEEKLRAGKKELWSSDHKKIWNPYQMRRPQNKKEERRISYFI